MALAIACEHMGVSARGTGRARHAGLQSGRVVASLGRDAGVRDDKRTAPRGCDGQPGSYKCRPAIRLLRIVFDVSAATRAEPRLSTYYSRRECNLQGRLRVNGQRGSAPHHDESCTD